MKYFVFGDVHGFYSLLEQKLKSLGFDENNKDHMLISLGDNFDRGCENYQMYEFLLDMKNKNNIILVKGNHEDLFLKMLYKRKATYVDITNGTYGTLLEFVKHYFKDEDAEDLIYYSNSTIYSKLNEEGILDFFYDMQDFYETKNYIFTHGFIPINEERMRYKRNWRDSTKEEFERSRWLNGIEMSKTYNISGKGKKIVVGHFHTSYGHVRDKYKDKSSVEYRKLEFSDDACFDIYEDSNIIALDACTALTKKINILVIDDEEML